MMERVAGNCNDVFMIMSCMKGVAGNCNVVLMWQGVEKSLLTGKRDRGFGSVSSQEQEIFLSEKQNRHDFLERSPESSSR